MKSEIHKYQKKKNLFISETWLSISPDSDFSIHNLPFGVFLKDDLPTQGVAIGDFIIDLRLADACRALKIVHL